jgi:RNA-directed DNA polymerase
MRLEPVHISYISSAFKNVQGKEDFLSLLNYCKKVLIGEKAIPFEMKQLNYYIVRQNQKRKYKTFTVKKKSGGQRAIHAPVKGLKLLQACLNIILRSVFEPHSAAYGFVPGKSIVDNARLHVGANYVYNIDLKDFFPSVRQSRVWATLQHPPFNLKGDRQQLANIIAALCCTELELEANTTTGADKVVANVLPQGAPTSPLLTNVVCQRLDYLLSGVAKRFGLKYSRYADDITFSSMHNVFNQKTKRGKLFIDELHRIINEQGFEIKGTKTRLQRNQYKQEVTGLIVNQKVNVNKRYVSRTRWWLFLWQKFGYDAACARFIEEYRTDKGHVKKQLPEMSNVISGKLEYLKMVKGSEDRVYIKLHSAFFNLLNRDRLEIQQLDKHEDILHILVTSEDLSKTMKMIK